MWAGAPVYFYAPAAFYPGAFYGWAINPWAVPIAYQWDWLNDPWYAYYGPYFRPYPVYARPSLWLTDYVLSAVLQNAFAEREAAAAASQSVAPLSSEVKDLVDQEVQNDLV
jgi:hypothetical protein